MPRSASTSTKSPSLKTLVATKVFTTQGLPNSLETIAAWQVMPPTSVTTATDFFIAVTKSTDVEGTTNTSPSFILDNSEMLLITLALPLALPGEAPKPQSSFLLPNDTFGLSFKHS